MPRLIASDKHAKHHVALPVSVELLRCLDDVTYTLECLIDKLRS